MTPSHRIWLYKKLRYIFQIHAALTAHADASQLVINELSKGRFRCIATENWEDLLPAYLYRILDGF